MKSDKSQEFTNQSEYGLLTGSIQGSFDENSPKKVTKNIFEFGLDIKQPNKQKSEGSQSPDKLLIKQMKINNERKNEEVLKEDKDPEISQKNSIKRDLIRSGELIRKNYDSRSKQLNLVKLKIPMSKKNNENDEEKQQDMDSILVRSVQVGKDKQFEKKVEMLKRNKRTIQRQYLSDGDSPQLLFSDKRKNLVIEDFEKIDKIGQGAYGEVFLVRHSITGTIYALKMISKSLINEQKIEENLFREIKIHSHLDHKNILRLYKVFHDQANVYMLLEYMISGTLWQLKRKVHHLSENKVSKIINNVCQGLKALHLKQIIHRDIKLQNIMLTEGIAKIGDFGCAVHSICMRKSKIGSIGYLSPEQLNHHFYNKKIDIWSIGIVTFQLIYGSSPYEKEILELLKKDEKEFLSLSKLVFPNQPKISDEAKDFILKALEHRVNARIDIDQALQHPFIQKKNQKKQ